MQTADVGQERVTGSHITDRRPRDIGLQEANLDVRLAGIAPGLAKRLRYDVDTGDCPAAARAVDRVMANAAADIEHRTRCQRGWPVHQCRERLWRLSAFPGRQAEAVHDPIGEAHGNYSPRCCRHVEVKL